MARIKKGWSQEDYLERLANEYLKEHSANPYAPTEEEWNRSRLFDDRRLKRYAYESTNYDPNLVYSKFQRINPEWAVKNVNSSLRQNILPYSRPITTLDIETDDFGRPITVSAVKTAFNKSTGQMEVIDTFQRFYKSLDRNLRNTEATHGLSGKILNKLRRQQGADYSWVYGNREREALSRFLGNSVVVGHNIHEFDIPKLFGRRIENQVVDTLIASRNIYGDTGKNSLDQVFKRIFGKSMEAAGLPHHDSMSDTIATAMIYEAMTTSTTSTGDALRKVLKHADLNLAPFDPGIDIKHGGSQLIRGPYWKYRELENAKYYIDKYGYTGELPMENNRSPEDITSELLGTSVHYQSHERGSVVQGAGDISDVAMEISALTSTIKELKNALGVIQTTGQDISGFGSTMSQYRKAQYIQTLARSDYQDMDIVGAALGIPKTDLSTFRQAAGAIKQQNEFKRAFTELRGYYRQGLGDTDFVRAMRKGLSSTWGDWSKSKTDILERDRAYAEEMEARRKQSYLRGVERKGLLSQEQLSSLGDLEGSYDDLVDATDELIKKNQQLLGVYQAIGKVRMYDPNQYLNSARGQASGILGAARGVVPSFLLDPVSRLTSATFNYQDRALTGWNAVNRVWNSGIGSAVTAGLTAGLGIPGMAMGMAASGGVNAISQLVGNVGQYRMERAGLAAQNTLNTLGAAASWISAPFKLLDKAVKTLIGSFSGLSLKLNNIMGSGISLMSGMGNPLTELTGMNYSSYQGTTMMDVASLFNRGSMNSVYESFANQQRAFYTTGEVNTSRLVASSLLGVYDKVYLPGTDAKGQYNSMVNQLLSNMQGQSADQKARTMYLASQIDANLPGLLRTANMLGVTDINQLTNPRGRGMYWNPITNAEERGFRWTQYEFGAATQQFDVTKMRLADKLWSAVGKDLYNGVNRIADSIVSGDWDKAVEDATSMWDTFKGKFTDVWDKIKASFGGEGGTDWTAKLVSGFSKIGVAALEVVRTVVSAWDQIVGIVLDKAQGLISYLSTVSIKPHYSAKDGFSFEVRTIKDQMSDYSLSDKIGTTTLIRKSPSDPLQYVSEFKGGFGELTEQLFPNLSETERARLTIGDIKQRMMDLRGTWSDKEGNAENMLQVWGQAFAPDTEEAINNLLGIAKVWGESDRINDAAIATAGGKYLRRSTSYSGSIPRAYRDAMSQIEGEIINPAIDLMQQGLGQVSQKAELNIKIDDKRVADVVMEDGKMFVSKVRTMLSDLVPNNLRLEVSQTR